MKDGWEVKRLGEVCETGAGGTPLKSHKDYYDNGTIPWLMSGEVSQGEIFESKNFITEKGLKNSSSRIFQKDTVLIAMYGATAGQVGILKFESSTNQAVCGILPNKRFIPKFLFYCFLFKKDKLVSQAVGGAQPNISQIKIKNTCIPVPPLPEQQRIVAILDEAFDAIEKAKENAEKNLQNARELFESYLQSVFANIGDGCIEKKLSEIAVVQSGGTPLRSNNEYWSGGGIPWYTSGELNDQYTKISQRCITKIGLENSNAKLFPKGSLLVGMYDTAALKMSILDRDAAFNQAIAGIKPNSKINMIFILHAINAIKPELLNQRRGVRQKNLSLDKIKNVKLHIPQLDKQIYIVAKLDALAAETKKLEAINNQKLADLDELKKSILQKAFNGEL